MYVMSTCGKQKKTLVAVLICIKISVLMATVWFHLVFSLSAGFNCKYSRTHNLSQLLHKF